MAKPRILIVDDEKNIVEAVKYNLDKEGFRTLVAYDGTRALEVARKEVPDAILLDWMLPEVDGLEVCRLLKSDTRTQSIPIIMVTVKSEEADKVVGLEMGADDYITKPFSQRELVARLRAALRRIASPALPEIFDLDELRIDWGKHVVSLKGKPVALTSKEFQLLKALIEANGRVLSQKALLETVWDYDPAVELRTHTVAFHISQLRKKLGHAAERIITVKNVGYRFAVDE